MMSEEIIAVVDALCEKLGLAVDSVGQLVPELAAWKASAAAIGVIASLLILIGCAVLVVWSFRTGYKEAERDGTYFDPDDQPEYFLLILCGLLVGLVMFVVLICNALNLVGWLTAPNVRAIEYILSLIG